MKFIKEIEKCSGKNLLQIYRDTNAGILFVFEDCFSWIESEDGSSAPCDLGWSPSITEFVNHWGIDILDISGIYDLSDIEKFKKQLEEKRNRTLMENEENERKELQRLKAKYEANS